jgi:hypothetical protein
MLTTSSLLLGLFTGALFSSIFWFGYKHKPFPPGANMTLLACMLGTPFIPAMASLVFADGGWMRVFESVAINASASALAFAVAFAVVLALREYLKSRRLI